MTKQGIIALVGTVLVVGLAVLDYRKLCRAWPVLFGGTVAIWPWYYAVCREPMRGARVGLPSRLHHSTF